MGTVTLDDAIAKAIASHGEWKTTLRSVIAAGATELDARKVGRADACDFGKWLEGRAPANPRSARIGELRELHARFHDAIARVIVLVDDRRRADALASLAPAGEFTLAANDLLAALNTWIPTI